MNREADELESIATNASANAEKIEKAKESIKGLNFLQLNVLDKILDQGRMEGGFGEGGFGEEKVEGKTGSGITMEQLLDFKIEILEELEKAKGERKENKKKISDEEKARIEAIKKTNDAIKKVKETEGNISEIHSTMTGIRSNPIGFGKGKILGSLGKLGIYGIIAQFAIGMAQQVAGEVIDEVKGWYKPGGVLDKRKMVLDVLSEYNSINYLTKIKSGGVFFTADAGQDLRQGAPRGAYNTRELRDGHMRFIQLHAGV